jgi:signal transduction histidine kinase
LERRLKGSLAWIVALTLALGLGGGIVLSRNWLGRIEAVNRTSREIIDGDLSRRVPVGKGGDEFDRLAANLNAMLDRIEALMDGLRQVTDNIAHDLRGPLTRLRNRLEVTLLEDGGKPSHREALERTIDDADQLLKTFSALLLIGEAEAGLKPDDMGGIDLAGLVGDMAELYAPAAEHQGLSFTHAIEADLSIQGNRQLLSQALVNLLDNALKYTPAEGRVSITCRHTDGAPEIAISDTGPGIADADRARVLQRFERLEASRHSPGSGLGLSLVAAVAKLHGAQLRLDDNAPGLRVVLRFETMKGVVNV